MHHNACEALYQRIVNFACKPLTLSHHSRSPLSKGQFVTRHHKLMQQPMTLPTLPNDGLDKERHENTRNRCCQRHDERSIKSIEQKPLPRERENGQDDGIEDLPG